LEIELDGFDERSFVEIFYLRHKFPTKNAASCEAACFLCTRTSICLDVLPVKSLASATYAAKDKKIKEVHHAKHDQNHAYFP